MCGLRKQNVSMQNAKKFSVGSLEKEFFGGMGILRISNTKLSSMQLIKIKAQDT